MRCRRNYRGRLVSCRLASSKFASQTGGSTDTGTGPSSGLIRSLNIASTSSLPSLQGSEFIPDGKSMFNELDMGSSFELNTYFKADPEPGPTVLQDHSS